ncbi:MAG: hypothetical protein AAFP84_13340 [Actinomycetota bacterium]
MFKRFIVATALVGPALGLGSGVSAADFADPTPTPPTPPTIVGDLAPPDDPRVPTYTITCLGSTACDSLSRRCADNGGEYDSHTGRDGETKGVCSG